jgi:Schlafen, AlbA_2
VLAAIGAHRDLPTRDGRAADYTTVGDYARNGLAAEIVAFANTYGGTIVIGIVESSDKPNRATAISALPDCSDLARRLRQSVQDIVDPPLPLLEARGIVTETDGTSGVVVMRVGKSRRAPHRSTVNKEVYVRREDESVRIGMREIQELTMSRLAEVHAIDEEIARRRDRFREAYARFTPENACGLHYVAVPTTSIDLGRGVKRPEIYAKEATVSVFLDDKRVEEFCWSFGEFYNWRPALRAVDAIDKRENRETRFSLTSGGLCEFTFLVGKPDHAPFYAPWFASSMGVMLNWIDRIRRDGGLADQEYAIAPCAFRKPHPLDSQKKRESDHDRN